jgi:hypothetical protein
MQLSRENEPLVKALMENLQNCESVLDLGCGQSSLLQYVPWIKESLGVEVWQPYIDESKKYHIHTDYIQSDLTKFVATRNYDAVICIDVIEHIPKIESEQLIKNMIRWADKRVIIYVPNGFMPQTDPYHDGNKYQEHVSEWSPDDFTKIGFKVFGYSGWKYLRGDGADIKIKTPGHLRDIVNMLSLKTESFCRTRPQYAFALLAVYMK